MAGLAIPAIFRKSRLSAAVVIMYFTNLASGEDVTLTAALCQGRILSEIVDFDAKPPFFHGVTLCQNRGFLRNLFREAFLRWNLMSHFLYRTNLWKYIMAGGFRKLVLRKCPNVSCTENDRFVSKVKKSNGITEKLPWFVKNQLSQVNQIDSENRCVGFHIPPATHSVKYEGVWWGLAKTESWNTVS